MTRTWIRRWKSAALAGTALALAGFAALSSDAGTANIRAQEEPAPQEAPIAAEAPTAQPALVAAFAPDTISLPGVGDSATVTVEAGPVPGDVIGMQINLQFDPAVVAVSEPVCTGIFAGGTPIPVSDTEGGKLTGCFFLGGRLGGDTGPVLTFVVTRAGEGDTVISLGVQGDTRTQFSGPENVYDAGAVNSLAVTP